MKSLLLAFVTLAAFGTCVAEPITGLCVLSPVEQAGRPATANLKLSAGNCGKVGKDCMEVSHSDLQWSRWTGVSPQALQSEGAPLTARLVGDAGEVACEGRVHDGALSGRFHFTPSSAFAQQLGELGFTGLTPRMQLSLLVLDADLPWIREMKAAGVSGLTTGQLIGLRALHVDAGYIHGLAAAGYPELRAGKLIEMKAVGVTPEKARDTKALGLQPTEEELIQMAIFKIDRQFIERMQARGVRELTAARLIKIKTFNLDDDAPAHP